MGVFAERDFIGVSCLVVTCRDLSSRGMCVYDRLHVLRLLAVRARGRDTRCSARWRCRACVCVLRAECMRWVAVFSQGARRSECMHGVLDPGETVGTCAL